MACGTAHVVDVCTVLLPAWCCTPVLRRFCLNNMFCRTACTVVLYCHTSVNCNKHCCTAVAVALLYCPYLEWYRRPAGDSRLWPSLHIVVDVVHSDGCILRVGDGDLTVHCTLVHCISARLLNAQRPCGILQQVMRQREWLVVSIPSEMSHLLEGRQSKIDLLTLGVRARLQLNKNCALHVHVLLLFTSLLIITPAAAAAVICYPLASLTTPPICSCRLAVTYRRVTLEHCRHIV
jgi:hypothetical protein